MNVVSTSDLTVKIRRVINAPVEQVFDAWLDADVLAKFFIPMEGMPAPVVKNDPRVGGRYSIIMRTGDQDLPYSGTYLEIVPHSKIVFTWEGLHAADGSTVSLTFSPAADGKTDLELVHVKFPDEDARGRFEAGWARILDLLAGRLAGWAAN